MGEKREETNDHEQQQSHQLKQLTTYKERSVSAPAPAAEKWLGC